VHAQGDGLKRALRVFVVALVAFTAWRLASPVHDALLVASSEATLHLFEPTNASVLEAGDGVMTVQRLDVDHRPMPIRLELITFFVVLLVALFAIDAPSIGMAPRVAVGLILLFFVQIFGTIAAVQSAYALHLGDWSVRNYSAFAVNFWFTAAQGFSIVGGPAATFGIWWGLREGDSSQLSAFGSQP